MTECPDSIEGLQELYALEELQEMYEDKGTHTLVPFKNITLKCCICPKPERPPEFKTYFITDGVFLKIGKSYNVDLRLKVLQTGNPTKLKVVFIVNSDVESLFHTHFKDFRCVCEWFALPEDYLDIVKAICNNNKLTYKEF